MKKKSDVLLKLGLRPEESAVYRSILQQGGAGVSAIAVHTGLHRPTVYKTLGSLLEKGLIAHSSKGKRPMYLAESPERLQDTITELQRDFQEELPDLLRQHRVTTHHMTVRFFEGPQGIRQAYRDLLATVKKGDVICRYESPVQWSRYSKYIPDEYRERLVNNPEVDWQIITNETAFRLKRRRLGRDFKMVPPKHDLFSYEIYQFIYRDKVSFIDFKHETAVIIEGATFAEFQKNIFKLLFTKL